MIFMPFMSFAQSELKVFSEWMTNTGTQNFFYKNITTIDASGYVYVAGATLNGSNNYDILVAKYNSSGYTQWIQQYNGTGNGDDIAVGMTIDGSGNVYITGTTTTANNVDVITIKYNSSGTQQWIATYNGTGSAFDSGTDIVTDGSGSVYITGSSYNANANTDIITIKYNSSGTQQWVSSYNYSAQLNDAGVKIIYYAGYLDISVLVQTTSTTYKYGVISYNTSGTLLATKFGSSSSTGIDQVNDMVTDASGNIYIAGSVPVSGQGYDYDIIKLDADLNLVWENTYDGSNFDDIAAGIKVDASGNVYITGTSGTGTEGKNIVTLKYNSSGTLQWSQTYNDTLNKDDEANAMAMDATGNIYITGSCATESDSNDYFTMKYDAAGNLLWTINSDGNAHLDDKASNIALTNNGDIFVTGQSRKADGSFEYLTIKYVEKQIITPTDYNDEAPASSFSYYCNRGQLINTNDTLIPEIKYYTNNSSPSFYFKDNSSSFVFAHVDAIDSTSDTLHRIDMSFPKGNSSAKTYPMEETRDYLNYFLAQCPNGITKVHGNKRLVTTDLYPNVDLMYCSNQNGIKMYFIVKPGGDLADLLLQFTGASSFNLDGTTNALTINSSIGSITYEQPTAYLLDSNNHIESLDWQCAWQIHGASNKYKFNIEDYDQSKTLVIQVDEGHSSLASPPNTPEWGTFFGGTNDDMAYDITADPLGNIYVVGNTMDGNFPVSFGIYIFQENYGGDQDVFVASFNDNYHKTWTTFYGGSYQDNGYGITYDNISNKIYICGNTSGYYPAVFAQTLNIYSYNDVNGGSDKGFIARFSNDGVNREWGTYFGGNFESTCKKIKTDSDGNIYVIGNNVSDSPTIGCTAPSGGGLPICNPGGGAFIQNFYAGGSTLGYDGYIAKFNGNTELVWSTLFGGASDEYFDNLAVDNVFQKLYVVGGTISLKQGTPNCNANGGFPLCNAGGYYQENLNGNNSNGNGLPDGFIIRFSLNGNLEWSTYFGGVNEDEITGIDVNGKGDVYVSGFTNTNYYSTCNCVSPALGDDGFPKCSIAGQYSQNHGGNYDAFIAKFHYNTEFKWSTFVGGSESEVLEMLGCAPKVHYGINDDIFIFGNTRSGSTSTNLFPVSNNSSYYMQSTHADYISGGTYTNTDNFICCFSANDQPIWSTYFGGKGFLSNPFHRLGDIAGGITTYQNRVYICGGTYSTQDFPLNCPGTIDPYCQAYTTVTSAKSDAFVAQLASPTASIHEYYNINDNNELSVYPNPSNGIFTINLYGVKDEISNISIYNMMGMQIKSFLLPSNSAINEFKIDLSDVSDGIYLLCLKNRKDIFYTKIIKQ